MEGGCLNYYDSSFNPDFDETYLEPNEVPGLTNAPDSLPHVPPADEIDDDDRYEEQASIIPEIRKSEVLLPENFQARKEKLKKEEELKKKEEKARKEEEKQQRKRDDTDALNKDLSYHVIIDR